MAFDLCKVTIIGRLGADPRLAMAGDKPVANLRVAASVGRGENETTNWFEVAIWGKLAEAIGQKMQKGDRVAVTGDLSVRSYESNGKEGYSLEIRFPDSFLLLEDTRDRQGGGAERAEPRDGGAPRGWGNQRPEEFNPPREERKQSGGSPFGGRR